ncbi:hypothetical protein [Erwinia sp. SLM-02]|uniref:hypothetical protein n=1 Tax=Erwinia sp. SLM-02 TaxID=3020057 RepID=UPI0030807D31
MKSDKIDLNHYIFPNAFIDKTSLKKCTVLMFSDNRCCYQFFDAGYKNESIKVAGINIGFFTMYKTEINYHGDTAENSSSSLSALLKRIFTGSDRIWHKDSQPVAE